MTQSTKSPGAHDRERRALARKDPVLAGVIREVGALPLRANRDLFSVLGYAITSQQISKHAADAIWGRFADLFERRKPRAAATAGLSVSQLRTIGFSERKASYLLALADAGARGGLDYRLLSRMDDDALIGQLTALPGIGRWTAEIMMIFSLKRPDVFPVADVGIQNAMFQLYGLQGKGRQLHTDMAVVAERWRPYRSLACRYLWRWRRVI